VRLGKLAPADLAAAHGLSAAVGWPHRLEEWRFAHALGSGFGWAFGERFGTVGMVIVAPALQGRGGGRRLLDAVLAEAGPRSMALIATPEGQRLYESRGFRAVGRVRQHQGEVRPVASPALRPGERLRPLAPADLDMLLRLDRSATGLPRDAALAALLQAGECVILERSGAVAGYALARRFGRGHLVGPVVAPDEANAGALIGHRLARLAGAFVRIDIPADRPALSAWLTQAGLAPAGDGIVMRRGEAPSPDGEARAIARAHPAQG
jgi:GNAT superfamily N-acetyltransferase